MLSKVPINFWLREKPETESVSLKQGANLSKLYTKLVRILIAHNSNASINKSRSNSPLVLGLVDDQQDLELPRHRRRTLLHQPRRSCGLLHHVGEGAEETGGLGGLRPSLGGRRSGGGLVRRRCRWGRSRSGGGFGGSSGWRWWRWVRPLEIRHVAIGQVGDETAVREATA